MRILFLLITILHLVLSGPVTAYSGSAEAMALGETFLAAMGGRVPWQKARWIHNLAVNHHPQARLVYTQETWIALEEPRQYIKLRNFDMHRDRALDKDTAWRLSEGKFSTQSKEEVADWKTGLQKSIYWKLSMLARRDAVLALAIGPDGRLEFRKNGTFLGWLMLAENGAPAKHGADEAGEVSTSFGKLLSFGAINWVRSGEENSGWSFEILNIRPGDGPFPVSTAAPDE